MCGIIGIISTNAVTPELIEGLKRLEYRGYDSGGLATLVNGHIDRRRAQGKIINLEHAVDDEPLSGTTGIGHTRWATHGIPNEANAHPHANAHVAVVHNGIIENFQELKTALEKDGDVFESDTDTEVIVHLVSRHLNDGATPREAAEKTVAALEGAFALAMIFAGHGELLIGARRGSPLAVGYGDGEMFIGSDALALAPLTRRLSYLEDGDLVELSRDGATVYDGNGAKVSRAVQETAAIGDAVGKGNFAHYMLKEIYEQPTVIGDTLNSFFNPATRTVTLPDLQVDFATLSRLQLLACGTSWHAALVARYWFEGIARLPVDVDIGSEFRYRQPLMAEGGASLGISQSGETADTLAALRLSGQLGQTVLSLVNVAESTMAREADGTLLTHAGPEIGVASTKAFTTQLTVLACLAIAAARARGAIDHAREATLSAAIAEVPSRAAGVLRHDERLKELAEEISKARHVLFLGRGTGYPVALEGALKLKEITYIPAEGFAAGEMKHGPIALIDKDIPIIVVAPFDELFEKTASNMQEVIARGGRVIFLSDAEGIARLGNLAAATIELPKVDPFVAPILYTIPVQLLAYHAAVLRGTDVDQPRNLAKSVTVE
ncbi:MAG: glutamine--fructose-6-phosphate transaminase (isomerizing) [Rhodospirillales bacterium]|nr:glutamine--fructose-6-phosphate transaminase (isomerizing) [Rhodospirillales bacterium]MBT5076839.1 glutamine--fructose-6-phosphate transaminase (isomerizing) [Rhodospirillales bacterium]MBT5114194.1 glutamine--fructose-6-phosphate transaminase (isomerizing) [Rhodospirillales bacterium]MBT5673064.1 glutamine--fructose-6-phosphate transaminase (isomerizing) [Rhodospirillales bacterium]MBT6187350.1 glutamine--fructose-6-phosphate transaminase (isomerizing) [Rhodospirillales bacterium]